MKKLFLRFLTSLFLLFPFLPCFAQPGTLDITFGENGIARTIFTGQFDHPIPEALALQPDGKILAAGQSKVNGERSFTIIRYHPDGDEDQSFGIDGRVLTVVGAWSEAYAITLQPDGKIVVGGYYGFNPNGGGLSNMAVARYQVDGSLDVSFGTGGIVMTDIGDGSHIAGLIMQPDNKIVAIGTSFAGNKMNTVLVRYNQNGTLDDSFGDGGIAIPALPGDNGPSLNRALALQPDGKMVVAGMNTLDGFDTYQFLLLRFNADGTLDNSFNDDGVITTFFNESSAAFGGLILQPDGKIVVGGASIVSFDTPLPDEQFALARYNSDGNLDSSFGTNGIVTTHLTDGCEVHALALQHDGKIIAGGPVEENSIPHYGEWGLVRYRTDGSIDQSFGSNGLVLSEFMGASGVKDLFIQPDGKILVTGSVAHVTWNPNVDYNFTEFNIARYHSGLNVATTELNQEENPIFVYPNPSTDLIYITVNELNAGDLHFTLTDITGKILLSAPAHIADNKFSLSISNLPGGVYLINIFGNGNLLGTEKIVVIREE